MITPQMKKLFDEQGYLTLHDYARLIGVSYQQVFNMVARGELPATNIGSATGKRKMWRIFATPLEQYFAERTIKPLERQAARQAAKEKRTDDYTPYWKNGEYIGPPIVRKRK